MSKVITIHATWEGPQFLKAEAVDEAGNVFDSHIHSSESWLINDWGLQDYTIGMEGGFTTTFPKRNTSHHKRLLEKIGEPFTLVYGEHSYFVATPTTNDKAKEK